MSVCLKSVQGGTHTQLLQQPGDPWQPVITVCRGPVTGNPGPNGELWT